MECPDSHPSPTPCPEWLPDSHSQASRKTKKKKEGGAMPAHRASFNIFSNFEQTQIQEFKEAFTLMAQNRDGFIDKEDLKDIFASLGTGTEKTILNAFNMLGPDGKERSSCQVLEKGDILVSRALASDSTDTLRPRNDLTPHHEQDGFCD